MVTLILEETAIREGAIGEQGHTWSKKPPAENLKEGRVRQ